MYGFSVEQIEDLYKDTDVHHLVIDSISNLPIEFRDGGGSHMAHGLNIMRMIENLCRSQKGVKILIAHLNREMNLSGSAVEQPIGSSHRVVGFPTKARYMSAMELHAQSYKDGVWVTAIRNQQGPTLSRYCMIEK